MDKVTYDALQIVLNHIRENDITEVAPQYKQLLDWSDEVAKEYDN